MAMVSWTYVNIQDATLDAWKEKIQKWMRHVMLLLTLDLK